MSNNLDPFSQSITNSALTMNTFTNSALTTNIY